ncbi:hypothetical protein [Zobellia galactanivorans]|uniref:hypothetical protein n=1 Tax=Zobellia galactanivorans (strain DSM 12802 / CCUG 47099 / CIP 106680 / NCIMB 13871 / Dsij) TaxID=63186 RepID=UPI001C067ABE|nr:hypothetical protein [Zobellia galactanivorans]MBU3024781.1 hypothetical protein [Zobellia galactanivorans]
MKTNIWTILFFTLLIVNFVYMTVYFSSNRNAELESKNQQIDLLKSELNETETEYIENAKQLKYMLETIIDNSTELKKYMTEYKDVAEKEFEEKLRQKIVRLDIEIEQKENK